MLVFIDKDYKCHTENLGNYRLVNVPFFDDKCETFIEGFHYIPAGETYKKETGEIITGRALFPFKDLTLLETIQRSYEEFLVYKEEYDEIIKQLRDEFLEYKQSNDSRFTKLNQEFSEYKSATDSKISKLQNHTHG